MVQEVKQRLARLAVRPSIRFLLVAILLVVAVFTGMATGFDLFYRLTYVLIVTLIVSYLWVQLMLRAARVEVSGRPRLARVGDEILETITIHNNSTLPKYALEVADPCRHSRSQGGRRRQYRLDGLRLMDHAHSDPYARHV